MAKKVEKLVKLQIPAGKATPAPPVGPALGQAGINIMGFTKEFNARTADQAGMIIPVVISVYEDKSFTFITKTPPAAVLLKKLQVLKKDQVHLTKQKLLQLLVRKYKKLQKLRCRFERCNLESAMRMIEGTARSMGFNVVD